MSTLMDLQKANLEKMAAHDREPPPVDTDLRESVNTDARTEVRAEASTPAPKPGRTPVRPGARPSSRTPVREDGLLAAVDAALESREPLVGGVKATVDMSPALSSRAKRYLADHRGQSTRQVMIALFDAFLTEKGY